MAQRRSRKAHEQRAQPRKQRSREPEETVVLSGRLMVAAVVLAAMFFIPFSGLGSLVEPEIPSPSDPATWKVGGEATVHVTLITADYKKLSCASEQTFDGAHCAYESETQRFEDQNPDVLDDNKKNVIQPYRTPDDNKLILIAGLWAEPALATRLQYEPSQGVAEKKLARFVTECKVEFIGLMKKPGLRWSPGGQWIHEGDALVAKPKSCKILEPLDI